MRDEVPDCRLATLASRFRLDHRPAHRALDDALATADLLHLLIERATGLGVVGLDDLVALTKLAGHPQAAKLTMTATLPRTPGVYLFRGHHDELLYVGKATNLRQRVRSYFGSDDRRRIGPMLRETTRIDHVELPDPLTAAVVEQRTIARSLPRYNRVGTRADRYCYVRLDTAAAWPRLSVVREPDAAACAPAQLGVAYCPCAEPVDAGRYHDAVEIAARALRGEVDHVTGVLVAKMSGLVAQQRFEEAAQVRDRLSAFLGAARRHRLVEALRAAGTCTLRIGDTTWEIDRARLVDATRDGAVGRQLPVEPPDPAADHRPIGRRGVDEALCLARHFDRHAAEVSVVRCSGEWIFPVHVSDELPRLDASRHETSPRDTCLPPIRSPLRAMP
ncbi:MAG: GIY-YIG nuclease family protein [Ilumatobacteraceae bacterium]